jgi:transmembrane sensor
MNRPAAETARLQDASDWVQRLHDSADPALVDQWANWCARDPLNLAAFERMQEIWRGFPEVVTFSAHAPQVRLGTGRRNLLTGLAASVLALLGTIAWITYRYPQTRTLSTAAAERHHERLPDGSQIDLAPNSRINIRYSLWRREVRMDDGQVYFAVAREILRPFVVHAGELTATASGTAFDVREARDGTVVTVSEGQVSIRPEEKNGAPRAAVSAPLRVHAGERVTLTASNQRLSVTNVDPSVAESWRSGMLEFVGQPLEAVVDEVDRFVNCRIVLASALQGTRYTGTVSPANVADWLEALKQIYSVQVIDEGANEIHIQLRGAHETQDRG